MPPRDKGKLRGKQLIATLRLYIEAGQARPTPPIGPALGQYGLNIMDFCKAYNAQTAHMKGMIVPAIVYIYSDKTFRFRLKTPPTSWLIFRALGIEGGSGEPNKKKVGKLTRKQLEEIAKIKMPDLNTRDIEKAIRIIAGQARSMGVEVEL